MKNTKRVLPYIERIEKEINELDAKIGRIRGFAKAGKLDKLSELERELLLAQYSAMQSYARILKIRIGFAIAKARAEQHDAAPQEGGQA